MKRKSANSGFSLIELIIAIAVLAFLMLAVSSFMGSSVMQSKKAKADVRLQAQAQETYSLITDTIMQASDIIIKGYTVPDDDDIDFSETEKDLGLALTEKIYVKDKTVADAVMDNPAAYGLTGSVSSADIVYFKDVDKDKKICVTYLRVESSVPIDMNQVPGASTSANSQSILNSFTGNNVTVTFKEQNSKKVYDTNDMLVSSFYFEGENMYYGRKYAFMTKLNDEVVMTNADSRKNHLYNKYFSFFYSEAGSVQEAVPGCVATIGADDGTIGIDLYYNKSSMTYTTLGRINTRNSYVLKPRK